MLRGALDRAKIGDADKIDGFKRLNRFVQAVEERCAPSVHFDQILAHERSISASLAGRTAIDERSKTSRTASSRKQLSLF